MGVQIPMCRGNFEGGKAATHCKLHELCVKSCAKIAKLIETQFGILSCVGPENHILDGCTCPHGKRNFLGHLPIEKDCEA